MVSREKLKYINNTKEKEGCRYNRWNRNITTGFRNEKNHSKQMKGDYSGRSIVVRDKNIRCEVNYSRRR